LHRAVQASAGGKFSALPSYLVDIAGPPRPFKDLEGKILPCNVQSILQHDPAGVDQGYRLFVNCGKRKGLYRNFGAYSRGVPGGDPQDRPGEIFRPGKGSFPACSWFTIDFLPYPEHLRKPDLCAERAYHPAPAYLPFMMQGYH
jgi:hypothetical protein